MTAEKMISVYFIVENRMVRLFDGTRNGGFWLSDEQMSALKPDWKDYLEGGTKSGQRFDLPESSLLQFRK